MIALRGWLRAGAWAMLLGAAASACGQPPAAEQYLVVGASDASPQRIAARAQELARRSGKPGLVVQVSDCGEPRQVFAWASEVAGSAAAAQQALAALKRVAPDAYVKRCTVQPGSLLALRLPAIDPTIAAVPAKAVNWSDADRLSRVVRLPGAGDLVLVRYYAAVADDPLEGRRTRVALATAAGELTTLVEDCSGAAQFVRGGSWVAFTCDTEQAADHILHTVRAYTVDGAPAASVARCRAPAIAGDALTCQSEEVDADGRLRLAPRTVRLAAR